MKDPRPPPPWTAYLEALPVGGRAWLRGLGRSLWPLMRSGDALLFERCEEAALRLGDIAVLRGTNGALRAHVVVHLQPLSTESLLGRPDGKGFRVLGRAARLHIKGYAFELRPSLLPWLGRLQRATAWASADPRLRKAYQKGKAQLGSNPWLRPWRKKWLGPLDLRLLEPSDLTALQYFCGDHLPLLPDFLARQLPGRWQKDGCAVGAVGRKGRLWAFAFADRYAEEGLPVEGVWIRSVFVAPVARGLGLAHQLVAACCERLRELGVERVYSDIQTDNVASLGLHRGLGFEAASEPHQRAFAEALRKVGRSGSFLVMEKQLRPGAAWGKSGG